MRTITVLLLTLLMLGSTQAQQSADHQIGINLSGIADWSTAHPFVDLFKTARPWISQRTGADWGQGGDLALTPEGWVASLQAGQYAETLMMTADPQLAQGMDGTYTILYAGEGSIAFRGNNVTILSEEPGRMLVDANPTQGAIFLQVVATNPANPLREIRFLLPGTESTYQTQPFNPAFLEKIAPFSGLRFMDWMMTNNATISTWAERPQPTDATYAWRGVPVEVMVQLANALQADAWFNMPHTVSDDYVNQFATYVRDHLDPASKAYIEYSNETWNGQFDQAWYVSDNGLALNLAPGDAFWSGLRFYSQRSVEIFAIWETVFGGTDRLVRVLATQAANAWTAEQVAVWQDAYQHADAISVAPYFSCDDPANPATVDEITALTVDQLLDRQLANVQPDGCAYQYMQANVAVAQQFGLELVAYEGGQHLAGYGGSENNDQLTALFIAANRHPRMGQVYEDYLLAWQDLGLGAFMLFNEASQPSMFGSWGLLESITQDAGAAPKYDAVLRVIGQLYTAPSNTNIVLNPDFIGGSFSDWSKNEGQGQSYAFTTADSRDVLAFTSPTTATSTNLNYAVAYQDIAYALPANAPLEITFLAGNTSSVTKQLTVNLRNSANTSQFLECSFSIPANAPLAAYTVRGRTATAWRGMRLHFWNRSADDLPALIMTAANVQYRPALSVTTTQCIAPLYPPPPPALNTPANSATLTTSRPTLSFLAVSGATGYELQLDAGGGFVNAATVTLGSATLSYTPPVNLMSTTYQWRVRAKNSAGTGNWSAVRSFTINNLTALPALWYFTISTPTLTWQAVANATSYELRVDDGRTATPALIFTTSDQYYILPALLDGTYTYQIRAFANGIWTAFTATNSFIVDVRS